MGEQALSDISTALILDRQLLCRSGLSSIIRRKFPACEVETSDSIEQAIVWLDAAIGRTLLIVDGGINLDRPDVEGIRGLRRRYPQLSLVVADWRRDRRSVLRAIEEGAHGYVPKDMGQKELFHALELIMAGQVYVPSIVGEFETGVLEAGTPPPHSLTDRQREVLTHMSMGKSNKEIAHSLRISESTVKVHVAASFRHLGVHNRVGAVAMLQRHSVSVGGMHDRAEMAAAGLGSRASDTDPRKRAFG